MSPPSSPSTAERTSFPRVSGDEPADNTGKQAIAEFSPRERG